MGHFHPFSIVMWNYQSLTMIFLFFCSAINVPAPVLNNLRISKSSGCKDRSPVTSPQCFGSEDIVHILGVLGRNLQVRFVVCRPKIKMLSAFHRMLVKLPVTNNVCWQSEVKFWCHFGDVFVGHASHPQIWKRPILVSRRFGRGGWWQPWFLCWMRTRRYMMWMNIININCSIMRISWRWVLTSYHVDESFVDVESLDCAIKAELKHDGIIYIYILYISIYMIIMKSLAWIIHDKSMISVSHET